MKWTAQFVVTKPCVVISNRTTIRPREGAYWSIHTMNLQYVAVINNTQMVGRTLLKFYSQITLYYITRTGSVVRRQASAILLGEGERKKLSRTI